MQLYLALSAVLASGGQQPLTALQEADAELAALVPDASKSKVLVLQCPTAVLSQQVIRQWHPRRKSVLHRLRVTPRPGSRACAADVLTVAFGVVLV